MCCLSPCCASCAESVVHSWPKALRASDVSEQRITGKPDTFQRAPHSNANSYKKNLVRMQIVSNHIVVISEQSGLIVFEPVEKNCAHHFTHSLSQLMSGL